MQNEEVFEILSEAKKLAQRYLSLTKKPLGVTGEIAEYEAARILGLSLTPPRKAGYDAIEIRNGQEIRVQIKGRCVHKKSSLSQRIGKIDITKEFDTVLLVLLDNNYEATVIYEAPRAEVIDALTKSGSKARNERGTLGVAKFKSIAKVRWSI